MGFSYLGRIPTVAQQNDAGFVLLKATICSELFSMKHVNSNNISSMLLGYVLVPNWLKHAGGLQVVYLCSDRLQDGTSPCVILQRLLERCLHHGNLGRNISSNHCMCDLSLVLQLFIANCLKRPVLLLGWSIFPTTSRGPTGTIDR